MYWLEQRTHGADPHGFVYPWYPHVPIPKATGTHTREPGYGFHAGVGAGGPIFTHGLPVTCPTCCLARSVVVSELG